MTLTGIRGWLVINAMAFPAPWTFLDLILIPAFGGVLSSIGTANVLGVPFAFALIGQDMILNTSALSAISVLSEFVPPRSEEHTSELQPLMRISYAAFCLKKKTIELT